MFTGRGETSVSSLAHGSSPYASSKPELRFPMITTRRFRYESAEPVSA